MWRTPWTMDYMWMKYCIFVAACVSYLVSVSHADEETPLCGTAGAAVVVHVSRTSLKGQFRCGPELFNLDPPIYSGNVYDHHACISPVKLSSRLPGAQVICSSKIHNLHTFSVAALPKEMSQVFYYRCSSPDRKRVCNVIVNVPRDIPIKKYGAAGRAPELELPTCSEPGATIVSYVSRTSRRAFFKCSPELSALDPPAASGTVYTNPTASRAVPLATLAPGVLVNLSPISAFYVFALLRLPQAGSRNYFYRCVSPVSNRQACTVKIVVPPELQSGSVPNPVVTGAPTTSLQGKTSSRSHHGRATFAKRVRTCSVQEGAIVSPLSAHSLSAQFTCAADLVLLDPPVLSGNVYVDKSCSRAVPLRFLGGGSLHMSPGLSPSYTVRLAVLPPHGPQAIFYKCRSPRTSQECLVEIKIPLILHSQAENKLAKPYESIPTCAKAGGVTEVNVDVNSKTARFKCGSSFSALHPSVTSGQVYPTRSCKVPMELQDHVGVGVNISETSPNLYTVSLLEMPATESKRFYYLCKEISGRGVCRVVINVPRRESRQPESLQAESNKLHVCHAGPDAAIRVTLHAHEAIRLRCAPGLTIQPQAVDEVFDNTDGTCSGLSTLQGLVPGAQLSPAFRDNENPVSGRDLVFHVDEAPHQHRELCYHCSSSAHLNAHDCKILITVPRREFPNKGDLLGSTVSSSPRGYRTFSDAKWSTLLVAIITLADVAHLMKVLF